MDVHTQTTKTISLEKYGIKTNRVHYQLSPEELHYDTIEHDLGTETNSGALAINTG